MSATIFYAGSPYQDLVFVLLEPFISGTRRVHYFEDLEEAKDDVARLGARCVLLRSSNDHARDGTMSQDDFIRDYLRCSTDSRRKPADLCAVSPEDYCWPENYHDIGPPKQVFVSMRRPMFAPGQDALLDRARESAPSQQSKRPQAGAPEERAAQRQRFER